MTLKWKVGLITTALSVLIASVVLYNVVYKNPCQFLIGGINCNRSGEEVLFYFESHSGKIEQTVFKTGCKIHRDIWQRALDSKNYRVSDGQYLMSLAK